MSTRAPNFSYEELNIMISALERDRDLITKELGKTIKNNKEQGERWEAVADLVNAVGLGQVRTGHQIRRKWNEMKSKIKKKAADLKNDVLRTGGGEPNYELHLSHLDQRILQLIGRSCYEGSAGLEYDLAAANNSVPITPSRAPASQQTSFTTPRISKSQPSTSTPTPIPQPQPSTSTAPCYIPQPQPSTSTASCYIPQPLSSLSFLNGSASSEYNDLYTEANSMPEYDDEGSVSIINRNNKENEPSWVFAHKNRSESSGTRRKRTSRATKRKMFDESDTETKVLETQDEMRNCLVALKNIGERQLENEEKMLNALNIISNNQELILNKLDELVTAQKNNNVMLQAIGGVQIIHE